MTSALAARFPGVEVAAVDLGDVEIGTTSRAIANVSYRAGAAPETVFVKAQGRLDHRLVLAAILSLRPEAWLLSSGEALPLEAPATYATAIDSRRLNTVLVVEDITASGGTPNAATSPLTPEQVADGLAGLARLHARFWDRPMPRDLQFLRPWRLASGWAGLALAGATLGLRRLRLDGNSGLLPERIAGPRALLGAFAAHARRCRTGPQTLLHGDAHVGNTYALPGGIIGWYDWQLTRLGSWEHDVGYFVGSALTVADRRAHERELLEGYLAAAAAAGASGTMTFDEAWERYRRTPAYGLNIFLQTLGLGGYQADSVSLTCIERFARAFDDLS